MRYILLPMLLLSFVLAGCADEPLNAVPNRVGEWPNHSVSIRIGETTIKPYERFESSTTYGEHGWLAGCGDMSAQHMLPEILNSLPQVTYDAAMILEIGEGGTIGDTDIYDASLAQIAFRTDYSDIHALSEGEYYIGVRVYWEGPYIPIEEKNESSCYEYLFQLSK